MGLTKASPFFVPQASRPPAFYLCFVLFLSIYPEICAISRLCGKHVKLSPKTI